MVDQIRNQAMPELNMRTNLFNQSTFYGPSNPNLWCF